MLSEEPKGPPEIDPIRELKMNDLDFVEQYSRKNILVQKMSASKCNECPKLEEQVWWWRLLSYSWQYQLMHQHAQLKNQFDSLKFALSDENLLLMPEFQTRCAILEKLNYIDKDRTVLLKGRVAREVIC